MGRAQVALVAALAGSLVGGCSVVFEPPPAEKEACALPASAPFADGFEDGTLDQFYDSFGNITVVDQPVRCGSHAARTESEASTDDGRGAGGTVLARFSTLNEVEVQAWVRIEADNPIPEERFTEILGVLDEDDAEAFVTISAVGDIQGDPAGLYAHIGNQNQTYSSSESLLEEGAWNRLEVRVRAEPDLVELRVNGTEAISLAAPEIELGAGGFRRVIAGVLSNEAPEPVTVALDNIVVEGAPGP